MRHSLIFCIIVLSCSTCWAQADSASEKIYNVNYKWELPVSVVFLSTAHFGFSALDKHSSLTEADVLELDPANINSFDRPVAFYDPSRYEKSAKISDIALDIAVASPVLLLLDKRIRKDWSDFVTIFLISHTVNNALYFSAAFSVSRPRPLTYNPGVSMEDKIGVGKSDSFFSGHVSWSATSTFLLAKMYTDYHQVKGWKRIIIFTGAAIPPGVVGYYRMHAGKHFKTDVITGFLLGAACGIGIPELHRIKKKDNRLSFQPFMMQGSKGISIAYQL